MIKELIQAFILIFIAEMGDKTQILAMAFSTKFPVKKVLLGIFIGSFLNHGLAVLLGSYLSTLIPINTISIIAGFAFISFALWTLKVDYDDEDEENTKKGFGPVLTVAIAFFIGELGDKTQLTAITLGAQSTYPLFVLVGTVTGMIVTGGMGIYVGKKLGDKVPDIIMKFVACSIFLFFGTTKLLSSLPDNILVYEYIVPFSLIVITILIFMTRNILIHEKTMQLTKYEKVSKRLYDFYHNMSLDIENICLGTQNCKYCSGDKCPLGNTKTIIKSEIAKTKVKHVKIDKSLLKSKKFDIDLVKDSLSKTEALIKETKLKDKKLEKIKKNLETIIEKSEDENN